MEMDGVRQIGRPRNTMGSRAKDNAKSFVLSNRYGTSVVTVSESDTET